jgi:6-phospho-beta-glucosidase
MRITIIGGGGVRVPLLVNGLVHSDLPVDEIVLFDIDAERTRLIGSVAAQFAGGARLSVNERLEAAIEGADYVFTSIRVGGIERRARDEQTALALGLVGQETVGPAGFAMAMRTIPHLVRYAREVQQRAPQAWIINFTNPVGIVTQAVTTATQARIIGICDTPTELFEDIAHALGKPSTACRFDYFGLNHLGWVREVYCDGEPQLGKIWDRPDVLKQLYRAPLFDPTRLRDTRLLPTEYVFFYEQPHVAVANSKRAGQSRGTVIEALNRQLFRDLARQSPGLATQTYERYLSARNAGYMQIESGTAEPLPRAPWAELTGYDKIALQTVRAIHFDTNAIIPLNVMNTGTIDGLESADVVEVPCQVGANGARPLPVGAMPSHVSELVRTVKAYERATVAAALSNDRAAAVAALALNPLVPSVDIATRLVESIDAD